MTTFHIKRLQATRLGQTMLFIGALALSYGFIAWAIDNGNLFCYFLAIIFFIGGLKSLVKLIGGLL